MRTKNQLTASLEDYLETIYHIIEEKQAARVKEIAKRLEVNNSSVTGALKSLSKKGYLNYAPYDVITLTEKGELTALDVIRRHEVMKKFIIDILCLDETLADDAACKMEHAVTPEVLERIIRFVEFTEVCPRNGEEWIKGFKRFCENQFSVELCKSASESCVGAIRDRVEFCDQEEQNPISLAKAVVGSRSRMVRMTGGTTRIAKKFRELEITPGSLFEVEGIDPGTGDISVGVRGYHLTLRKGEASQIKVILYT